MNKSSNELSRRKLRNMILKTVHNYKNTSDKIPNADMREIYDGIICCSEYAYARHLIRNCKKNIPDYYLNNLNSFISKEYLDKLSDEKHNRLAEKSSVENASSMSINEDNQKILDELEKRIWDSNVSLPKENLYNPSKGRHRHLAEKSRHFSAPVENAPSYSMLISEDDQKMLDEREKMFEDHNETSPNSKILNKGIRLSDIFAEGSYAYETYATKYDTIIEKQKRDIDDGNEQNYSKNAREFTKLMNEALNDDKLTKTEKQSVSVIMNAQAPLFWNMKRKDTKETLDKRMLKYYNGTLTKEGFFDKSDDIATEVKDFNSKSNEVTSASILNYVNLKEGEELTNSKILTKGIRLSDIFAEGSYAYETYATKYDTIIEKQKRDIDDGNEQNYSKNAREFTKLMNEALNDDKLTKTEKQSILVIMNAREPLFWNTAPRKDEQAYFRTEYQSPYNTSALDEWLVKNDITTDIDFGKTNSGDKSKNEYVASDKKDAKKHAGMADEDEPKLYEEGGKKISGSKGKTEMVSETTIKTSCCKKPVVVSDKDLTKKTETSKGGSVVSTSVKTETTSEISEYDVPPEKESEELVESSIEKVDETGDTVITDDEYNRLKRENLKSYGLINREMTMLGGLAGLSALAIKKRYKDKDTNKKDPEKK